jgi:hypothetical protein
LAEPRQKQTPGLDLPTRNSAPSANFGGSAAGVAEPAWPAENAQRLRFGTLVFLNAARPYAKRWLSLEAESMNEVSVYVVERNAWSTVRLCEVHFRLTYERVFLPVQNLWRDFLVHSEETGLALAA